MAQAYLEPAGTGHARPDPGEARPLARRGQRRNSISFSPCAPRGYPDATPNIRSADRRTGHPGRAQLDAEQGGLSPPRRPAYAGALPGRTGSTSGMTRAGCCAISAFTAIRRRGGPACVPGRAEALEHRVTRVARRPQHAGEQPCRGRRHGVECPQARCASGGPADAIRPSCRRRCAGKLRPSENSDHRVRQGEHCR